MKPLRAKPAKLSGNDVKTMLVDKDFFASDWNKEGRGIKHDYETIIRDSDKVVLDHTTSLMWQYGGYSKYISFAATEKYILELNSQGFAGFKDWRLPTLEEAMSLVEHEKKNVELYIDKSFDRAQESIWTVDQDHKGRVWAVSFSFGYCGLREVNSFSDVCAVR